MGKKHRKEKQDPEPVLGDSDIEEADIEALARSQLKEGEVILGDRGDAGDEAQDKRGVLNKPMLLSVAKDIDYKPPEGAKRVPWIDTLTIESSNEIPKHVSSKDGVKLESEFLSIAADAVKEAYRRLRVMKVPCSRPPDFYAEMMRPDNLMFKVRSWASEEQRRIKIVEERKKGKAAKKFAKKARSEKLQARAKEKRQTLEDISAWRKENKRDGKSANDQDLEDILNRQNVKKRGEDSDKGKGKGKGKKSKKREAKDARFGHGGKKSGKKRNDAFSVNDLSSAPFAKKGKGKGKGKGGKGSLGVKKKGKR